MVVFDFVKGKQKLLRKQGFVIGIILQNTDFQNFKSQFPFTEFLPGIFKLYNWLRMNFGVSNIKNQTYENNVHQIIIGRGPFTGDVFM